MLHTGNILGAKANHDVIECQQCRYRHLSPIPSSEELERFYKTQYFDDFKPDYLKSDTTEEQFLKIAYDDRLANYDRLAPGNVLLDVGCGSGKFLEYAREKGWVVCGIEPSLKAATAAKQLDLDVFHGTFEEFLQVNSRRFDVVQFKNVLEHVPNPRECFSRATDLLTSKGVVYVEVPNDFDLIQKVGVAICNEEKSWISVPDHINYFNFTSLKNLIKDVSSMKIALRDTTFPMYLFLWFKMNFIKDKKVGKQAHRMRVSFELFFRRYHIDFVRRALYRLLAQASLGRTVIYYCIKRV